MSALESSQPDAARRPQLRGVLPGAAKPISGLSFVLLVAALLVGGLVGLLMLNTQIQDQGFLVNELNADARAHVEREAALRTELDVISSSSELVRRAGNLGMVPYAQPGYLTSDGQLVGTPKPGAAADVSHIKTDKTLVEEARAKAEADKKAAAEAAARAKAEAEEKARAASAAPSASASAPGAGQSTPAATPSKKA